MKRVLLLSSCVLFVIFFWEICSAQQIDQKLIENDVHGRRRIEESSFNPSQRWSNLLHKRILKKRPKNVSKRRRRKLLRKRKYTKQPPHEFSLSKNSSSLIKNNEGDRDGRFFSLFTVVRFANEACPTTSGNNGTCYTKSDCESRGGRSDGTCASGFGVCCYFSYQCGDSTNQNGTYFKNPSNTERICNLMITRMNDGICQIRLELDTFDISPPDANGECTTDFFLATGGSHVPQLCGQNTGQHVIYSITPNSGPSQISVVVDTTSMVTTSTRTWSIRILQYECTSPNLAPNGCLQHFTGASGEIKSFNYKQEVTGDQPNHLAKLNYAICIRMENGYCGIRYSQPTADPLSFTISGDSSSLTSMTTFPLPTPGVKIGDANCRSDYLVIPGGSQTGENSELSRDRFCGSALGYCSTTGTGGGTTCTPAFGPVITMSKPFIVGVITNDNERSGATLTDKQNRGFHLNYNQQPCFIG